jgi:hypothetical protein
MRIYLLHRTNCNKEPDHKQKDMRADGADYDETKINNAQNRSNKSAI